MADDTRVTRSRPGLACAVALLWAAGCALPAVAGASGLLVGREAGLNAAERAAVRADAGAQLKRTLTVKDTEVVSVPAGHQQAALAILNADPDVRYAVPDVAVHAAAPARDPEVGPQ